MQIYNFQIVVTQDENDIYVAKVPDLPGCHTQAKSLDELYKRAGEAISLCLEVQKSKQTQIIPEKFIGVQQIQVAV